MKTKLIVRYEINALRFGEKTFLSTILCFPPYWDHKTFIEYVGEKFINLSTKCKIHLKCKVIDESILNGVQQQIWYSFVLDKLPGYEVFCKPETNPYKKKRSVLNTIFFYLENDNHKEVNFNGETSTFTPQMITV